MKAKPEIYDERYRAIGEPEFPVKLKAKHFNRGKRIFYLVKTFDPITGKSIMKPIELV